MNDGSDSEGIAGRYSGVGIRYVPTTGSTNADLERSDAPHGTTLVAGQQHSGRGRLGRTWSTGSGNLAMSVLLRPDLPVERVPLLCLAAGVAVVRSVGGEARIKWPNDVLVRGRKLAGILAATRGKKVVVGIGVNLVSHPLEVEATDLATLGMHADPVGLAAAIRDELLGLSRGLGRSVEPVLNAWRSLSCTLGAQVRIGQVQGKAMDIDDYGGLLVLGDEGVTRVLAGDVEMVSDMGR